jgi:hypothetical protein
MILHHRRSRLLLYYEGGASVAVAFEIGEFECRMIGRAEDLGNTFGVVRVEVVIVIVAMVLLFMLLLLPLL